MLGNKIVYFKKIYNFGPKHEFIGVILFVYYWKILLKIKKNLFLSAKRDDRNARPRRVQIFF